MEKTNNSPKEKLIIHETDHHGCGTVIYKGNTDTYSYDDELTGDIRAAVQFLIDIGFIDENEVRIIEGDDIYDLLDKEKL